MEQHTQAIDHTLAEPQSDSRAQHSMEWIVRLLIVVRYLFVISGAVFLAWELFEVLLERHDLGLETVLNVNNG